MHTVTTFHASAVQPKQVSVIMTEYLALERARTLRRLLVTRLGPLAFFPVAAAGLHWLSTASSWFAVAVLLAAPAWAWIIELGRDRRLARQLKELPGASTHILPSNPIERTIKSS